MSHRGHLREGKSSVVVVVVVVVILMKGYLCCDGCFIMIVFMKRNLYHDGCRYVERDVSLFHDAQGSRGS